MRKKSILSIAKHDLSSQRAGIAAFDLKDNLSELFSSDRSRNMSYQPRPIENFSSFLLNWKEAETFLLYDKTFVF